MLSMVSQTKHYNQANIILNSSPLIQKLCNYLQIMIQPPVLAVWLLIIEDA